MVDFWILDFGFFGWIFRRQKTEVTDCAEAVRNLRNGNQYI